MTTEDMIAKAEAPIPLTLAPEDLLRRAVEALDRATADSSENGGTSWDWVGVSQAAVGAGQLALDIQNSEPKAVVVDDVSGLWQMQGHNLDLKPGPIVPSDEHTVLTITPPGKQMEGLNAWLTPDEWDTILALRVGSAVVMHRKPSVEGAERPVDDLADVAGTHDHPRDLDASDVAADGDRHEMLAELNENLNAQATRYQTIIVGLMLARSTVSEYVPGALIRQTPPWRLEIGENPADGAVTLRIDRS